MTLLPQRINTADVTDYHFATRRDEGNLLLHRSRAAALRDMLDGYHTMTLYHLEGEWWEPKVHVPLVTSCDICGFVPTSRRYLTEVNQKAKPQFTSNKACEDCRNAIWKNTMVPPPAKPMSDFLVDPTFQYYK